MRVESLKTRSQDDRVSTSDESRAQESIKNACRRANHSVRVRDFGEETLMPVERIERL